MSQSKQTDTSNNKNSTFTFRVLFLSKKKRQDLAVAQLAEQTVCIGPIEKKAVLSTHTHPKTKKLRVFSCTQ